MWINGGRCDLTEKKSVCKVSVKAIGSDAAAHSWHDAFVCGYFSPFFRRRRRCTVGKSQFILDDGKAKLF